MEETNDGGVISNVAKATRQELMDGYRALLKKYKEMAGSAPEETGQKQIFGKIEKYKTESDVNSAINSARLALQQALADIETKLEEKFIEMKKFDEAILFQDKKLKEKYEIETEAGALLALLQAKEEAKRQAENDRLETEQKRKRDEEEYKFNFELLKRKDKEAFEAEKRAREVEMQTEENLLAEKQKQFSAKESEFANMQKQVAEFPSRLEMEKQQLEKRLLAESAKDKETALLFLQKESDAQKTVYEGRVKALENMLEEQKRSISSLQEQLKASQLQVQEVVLKSIEGASGAKTLDVVNKLALEQSRAGMQR